MTPILSGESYGSPAADPVSTYTEVSQVKHWQWSVLSRRSSPFLKWTNIPQAPDSYGVPSADPVTEYNNNNNDNNGNNNVPAIEASDSYGIPQGDPFTEEEASAAPTGHEHNQ